MLQLCPSMLSADFNRLGEQIQLLEQCGIQVLHIDVMDGDFVPSISFGMPVIKSIRKESKLFFDTHLMVSEPIRYIQDFVDSGADSITVHAEACSDLPGTLAAIKKAGVEAAVSINPATPVSEIVPVLGQVDMVLLMTVVPGFGGQSYIHDCTDKIREVRKLIDESYSNVKLQVDGGVNKETLPIVLEAGANMIVAGSYVFKGDIAENIRTAQTIMDQ